MGQEKREAAEHHCENLSFISMLVGLFVSVLFAWFVCCFVVVVVVVVVCCSFLFFSFFFGGVSLFVSFRFPLYLMRTVWKE